MLGFDPVPTRNKNLSPPTTPSSSATSPSTSPSAKGQRRLSFSKVSSAITPKSPPKGAKSPPFTAQKKVTIHEEKEKEKDDPIRTRSIASMLKSKHTENPFAKSLPVRFTPPDSHRHHTPPVDFMKGVTRKNRIERSPEGASKSQLTSPREKKPVSSPPSVSSPPTELFQTMEQGLERLYTFASHLEEQVQERRAQLAEFLTEENTSKLGDKNLHALLKKFFSEALFKEWSEVEDSMYATFFNEDLDDDEEGNRRRSISFSNLGLEQQLDPKDFESLKSGLKNVGKNFKGEKHLELAFQFISEFLIDFESSEFYNTKANRAKLVRFGNEQTEMPCVLFNYMISLNYLGELLKNLPPSLFHEQETKEPHIKLAREFIKKLKKIKDLVQDDRVRTTKAFCNQCGRSLINYSKALAKRLSHYVETSEKDKKAIDLLSPAIDLACINSMMSDGYFTTFGADFDRALSGNYFIVSGDQQDSLLEITSKIAEDHLLENERLNYCKQFLLLLYQKLDIQSSDLSILNPLGILGKEKSLTNVCAALEREWKIIGKGQFKGIFKLLPFMRMFQQSLLWNMHCAIFYLERELTGNKELKIIREHKSEGTKKIHLEFNEIKARISFWRSGTLDKLGDQRPRDNEMSKYCYANCLINSTVILTAPIENLENWEVEKFVEIEKPISENANLAFLKRFSELIATLETMGIPYSIKEV